MVTRYLPKIRRCSLALVSLLILFAGAAAPLRAAVFTWTGEGVDNAWTTPGNWTLDSGTSETNYPVAGDTANVDFSGATGNVSVSNGSVGVLNVGYDDEKNFSFGGGSSAGLTLQVTSGSARINKGGTKDVTFIRRVDFASDTVITANGGRLIFERDGTQAVVRGNGNLTFEGAGGVSLFRGDSTVFSTGFHGNTLIQNNGTLLINSTFQTSTSTPAASLTVGNTGTLGGTGTVARATTIQTGGTLSPGDSTVEETVSIATYTGGLTFEAGANFRFELTGNTTAGRGTAFDGIDITAGPLSIDSSAQFHLRLDQGDVDFSNAFWQNDQQWLVFDNANAPVVDLEEGIFQIGSISQDSLGQNFSLTGGSFSFTQSDNDIYLVYTAIPEPASALLLLGTGAMAAFLTRRRAGKA